MTYILNCKQSRTGKKTQNSRHRQAVANCTKQYKRFQSELTASVAKINENNEEAQRGIEKKRKIYPPFSWKAMDISLLFSASSLGTLWYFVFDN